MSNVIDFNDARLISALNKVLDGTSDPVSAEDQARWAAEGAALIREHREVKPL